MWKQNFRKFHNTQTKDCAIRPQFQITAKDCIFPLENLRKKTNAAMYK